MLNGCDHAMEFIKSGDHRHAPQNQIMFSAGSLF